MRNRFTKPHGALRKQVLFTNNQQHLPFHLSYIYQEIHILFLYIFQKNSIVILHFKFYHVFPKSHEFIFFPFCKRCIIEIDTDDGKLIPG